MSQQPVRVAVVGYGWWGKIITKTLADSTWLQVAMVVEPDAAPRAVALADAAAAQAGAAAAQSATAKATAASARVVTADFNDAIADPQIEAVILTTPHRFTPIRSNLLHAPANTCFAKSRCARPSLMPVPPLPRRARRVWCWASATSAVLNQP